MITSNANGQIKKITALKNKAKMRAKENCYIVEGIRMIKEVPSAQLMQLYVSESGLQDKEIQSIIHDMQYEVVKDSVFSVITDTVTPQGILAVVRKKNYNLKEILNDNCSCIVVLENLQDPGNLGTIIRTAEGAGVCAVIMDHKTVDIYNPKVIRSTMGSVFRVPFYITDNLEDTLETLKHNGIKLYAADLRGASAYYDEKYEGKTAFMIGNEGNGLSDAASDKADVFIKIPMEGQVESLNASVAAAILMYEVKRQK